MASARGISLGWLCALAACTDGPGAGECYGVCGAGTRCEAGRCVAVAVEPEPALLDPDDPKRARKGRRRGRAGDAEPAATEWQPISDRSIPAYDPRAAVELGDGSERPDDALVRGELRGLEPAFDRCIADAVAAGVTVPNGRVEFELGLTASGKVAGVNAKASPAIRDSGIVPCLRKVIYDHRFPKYDGPPMGVDYSFEIG